MDIRKLFPKCLKLDGIDLPPPISFDISDESHLPDARQTFLCSADGESITRQFLEQYYRIYDNENRGSLLNAYHPDATFSLTSAYAFGHQKDKNMAWLNWYNTDNRNLLKVSDFGRRFKLLKRGNGDVVDFLREMPETRHDIHSFTVDLTLFTEQMLCLTVSGMFKELNSGHKYPPIRYFFRTLAIVPMGSGFCICNEELHITNATPQQAKEAFKIQTIPTPTPGTTAPPTTPESSPQVPDDNTKQEMVKELAMKTGMNWEWSVKCLEGNDWDFMRAATVFANLQGQGQIPAEAFVKT